MDPITQSALGAVAAGAVMSRRLGRVALLAGALGGALPDLDVLWAEAVDPDLPWTAHRHFTHALAFIPVGGVVAALPLLAVRALRTRGRDVVVAATIGWATHGLLDTCTAYGTRLLWPFSADRLAWDVISIIDPVFTLVLLTAIAGALLVGRGRPAAIGLAVALLYLALGAVQHERAARVQRQLADERAHELERGRVMPTLGNLLVWRSVYESGGMLHADAIRLPPGGPPGVRAGTSIARYAANDLPDRGMDPSRARAVFQRFAAFADGYTAAVAHGRDGEALVGDMRYSLDTAGFEALWGVRIDPSDPIAAVRWTGFRRDRGGALHDLWREITAPVGFVPVSGRFRTPGSGEGRSP